MKKYFNQPAVLFIAVLLFISCSKASVDGANTTPDTTTAALTASLTSGSWVVSSLTQKTEDKTSKFSGFVFIFSANGTVIAKKDASEISGNWQYTPAVTYYGSSSKSAIALNLGTSVPLNLLTKKWNFISGTNTVLQIESPEVLEDEHLQFTKQ